mmetsp:Transcript_36413/g.81030  ORF Transcript_36413/g.81030 Transcript_36413/m.81030 type:complete len:312 (-) Transcript_36413:698-1633(-)
MLSSVRSSQRSLQIGPGGTNRAPTCLVRRVNVSIPQPRLLQPLKAFPEAIDSYITYGTVISSCVAILVTAGVASRSPPVKAPIEENFEWAVAGVVSCIPLFNWLTWVLPALQDDSRAALYYSYAALYIVPLLRSGFDFDTHTLLMLFLCAVHVQMERIARTEPEVLQSMRPLALVSGLLATALKGSASFAGSLFSTLLGDAKTLAKGPGVQGGELGDPESRDMDRLKLPGDGTAGPRGAGGTGSTEDLELKQFDRQLLERDRKRKQQQQEFGRELQDRQRAEPPPPQQQQDRQQDPQQGRRPGGHGNGRNP